MKTLEGDLCKEVAEAARAYVGEHSLDLGRRRLAGESHIGMLASPQWTRLVTAVLAWADSE